MTVRRLLPILAASIAVLAIAGASYAGGPAKARAAAPPATAKAAPATPAGPVRLAPAFGGLIVGIDPETGVLGPATAQQRLALLGPEAAMLSRSTDGLVEFRLPDGGVGIDLAGRFQELSYVRVGADGRYVFGCTDDIATLRRSLATPVRPAPVLEDR